MSELKAIHPVSLQMMFHDDLYLIDPIRHTPLTNEANINIHTPTGQTASLHHAAPSAPIAVSAQNVADTVFEYLGDNNRYVLLLVDCQKHAFMDPKELEALQNILAAKKMELKDVALVNLHTYPQVDFGQLKSYFACNKMVLFGIAPSRLKLPPISSNQPAEHQGVKILGTFSFTEMMDTIDKKKAFWNVMKLF